ncbi:DDE superfamily endonuclease [Popillia japonica]|uniref:DDE superfamily endonuclease n=1 Tax=Popillia japonica TaxID=7064 RepID=A0AAW1JI41_POPJA
MDGHLSLIFGRVGQPVLSKMPTKYRRKGTTTRGNWSEESLQNAIDAVKNGMAVMKASKNFGIPRKTLERRVKKNDCIKRNKDVHALSSGEKGETISVIASCNAEGTFLPPVAIFKGKNKKDEFEDGMPPGAAVYMSEKSAYVNTTLFLRWLEEMFIPRKPNGKVVLVLDGHASHCTSVELLELADANDVVLICLPSHTTHFLQPLC